MLVTGQFCARERLIINKKMEKEEKVKVKKSLWRPKIMDRLMIYNVICVVR